MKYQTTANINITTGKPALNILYSNKIQNLFFSLCGNKAVITTTKMHTERKLNIVLGAEEYISLFLSWIGLGLTSAVNYCMA